jgi:purine-binding chemotaxis protein CheW
MSQMRQLTTFLLGNNLYGIDVSAVQEVTGSLPIVPVPLAPPFVKGLINLRGQIATAIGLSGLIGAEGKESKLNSKKNDSMSVICRLDGHIVSLLVDSIGDVMEVPEAKFESVPMTVPEIERRFLSGVFKTEEALLCVFDTIKIAAIATEAISNAMDKKSMTIEATSPDEI